MPRNNVTEKLTYGSNSFLSLKYQMAKEAALGMNWLHCGSPMFIHRVSQRERERRERREKREERREEREERREKRRERESVCVCEG